MHNYAMADEDGRILQVNTTSYRYIACTDGVRDDTHYVDSDGDIRPKRALEVRQDVDGLTVTLAALPMGLTVKTNGLETVTDDEPLVINYDVPGTYELRLSGHVEYLDETLEVTVGDP